MGPLLFYSTSPESGLKFILMKFTKPLLILLAVTMMSACTGSKIDEKPIEQPIKSQIADTKAVTYQEFRAKQKSYDSSDGAIKYIDQGEGDVILLLHGIPTSSWLYRKMVDDLVAGGHRVIAPDMLGFGSSDNPDGYEVYSPENHAKRIIELMDHLKVKTWTHVMHDAGGLWTWEVFKKVPKRIKRLIVLNTIIYKEGFNPPVKLKKGKITEFIMWLYRNKTASNELLVQLFDKGLEENTLTDVDLKGYQTPLQEGRTKAMYYFFSNTCNELTDYDELLNSLDIPVSIIWGGEDDMLMWAPQKERVQKSLKVKDRDIHVLKAKHFIQERFPDKISGIINSFIRRTR